MFWGVIKKAGGGGGVAAERQRKRKERASKSGSWSGRGGGGAGAGGRYPITQAAVAEMTSNRMLYRPGGGRDQKPQKKLTVLQARS